MNKASKRAPRVSPHCERLARNFYKPRSHGTILTGRVMLTTWNGALFPTRSSRSLATRHAEQNKSICVGRVSCFSAHVIREDKRAEAGLRRPRRARHYSIELTPEAMEQMHRDGCRRVLLSRWAKRLFARMLSRRLSTRVARVEHEGNFTGNSHSSNWMAGLTGALKAVLPRCGP